MSLSPASIINAIHNHLGDEATLSVYKASGEWCVVVTAGDTETQCRRSNLCEALSVTAEHLKDKS